VRACLCATAVVTAAEVIAICQVLHSIGQPGQDMARWLTSAVRQMTEVQLLDLLYFGTAARTLPSAAATGALLRFVPVEGMSADHLPVSHTCSNQVDMPLYPSFEVLQTKLLEAIAISAQQGGFQMA
jgi:hypothetical protein